MSFLQQITIVTGLTTSGKTTYCKNSNEKYLSFDSIYIYEIQQFNINMINDFLLDVYDSKTMHFYLDAYNLDLLNIIISFFKSRNYVTHINVKFIYREFDEYYETISSTDNLFFGNCIEFPTYDMFINNIYLSITNILQNLQTLKCNKIIYDILFIFRDKNNYINYNDDTHLMTILNESKHERLLRYVDKYSGCKYYQSIIIDDVYIRRGSEKDWLTYEHIKECTTLKNKVILDTGCFNGYFSFMALKDGACKVIGVDNNQPALSISKKISYYNNYHKLYLNKMQNNYCENGIHFIDKTIGKDNLFDDPEISKHQIDIIFVLNYLHHVINQYGIEIVSNVIKSFFNNTKEIIFEVNEKEIANIIDISLLYNFELKNKIESHRKTSVGDRYILYLKKNE